MSDSNLGLRDRFGDGAELRIVGTSVSRRKDGSDRCQPLAAAMRETEEEIGLDRQFVDPIGYLDLRFAFSGFRILPVVAHVTPGYSLALNAPKWQRLLKCRSPS
jgi:8-oxo-dGTP pyrophosphatase MutT (NUDIX family)